jgi:nicotinamidase-related amidase
VIDRLSIDRNKTAVLIMDYQNLQFSFFVKEEKAQKELLEKANAVLAKAREVGIPVIYVEDVRGERNAQSEIHPAIKPKADEQVFTKYSVGPFATTNLDEVLKKQGIDTLIIMGIATIGCVLTTVRWGSDIGYRCIVVSDCCANPDQEVQRFLMEKIFGRGVATSADIIKLLSSFKA